MNKSRWTVSPCPKCGREERHDVTRNLKLCAICLMRLADAVDQKESAQQKQYDLKATVLNIREKHNLSQKHLAQRLHIAPSYLAQIVSGSRPFPSQMFERFKERYRDCLVTRDISPDKEAPEETAPEASDVAENSLVIAE